MLNTSSLERFLMFLVFIVIVVLIMAGIGVFLKNASKDHSSTPGHWTDTQKKNFETQVIDYMTTEINPPFDEGIARCVANTIEDKYTYEQAMGSGSDNPMNGDLMTMVAPCAGTKGDWNPAFKSGIITNMTKGNPSIGKDCISCIVDGIEKQVSPADFVSLTANKQTDMANTIMATCKACDK